MIVDHDVAEQFARENWEALAAAAWRFQVACGPGALVVDWDVVMRWRDSPFFRFQPRYSTQTENADFNALIACYDPRKAIVIAFADGRDDAPTLRPGRALAAMTITAKPSPPEAHRASGN